MALDVAGGTSAFRLLMAVSRLRTRARLEGGADRSGLSLTQIAILGRVIGAPQTAAQLALAEHVTQQAIAQSLAGLRERALVRVRPDPTDGRKGLVEVTPAGVALRDELLAARERWLARAIEEVVKPGERETLAVAIELLERLTEAEARSRT